MKLTEQAMNFRLNYHLKIEHFEKQMVLPKESDFSTIEAYKLAFEKCVKATHDLEEFCSTSEAGKSYFKAMWRDCLNSTGKFDWVKMVDKECSSFLKNYDSIALSIKNRQDEKELFEKLKTPIKEELLNLILNNQGILQKNVFKLLSNYPKQFVVDVLMSLVKEKTISRHKVSNTYALYLTSEMPEAKHLLEIPSHMTYEMLKEWIYDDMKYYKEEEGYMYQPNGDDEDYAHLMPLIWGQQHRDEIEENGMDKFYILLASILWKIENDEVEERDCLFALPTFIDFYTDKYDYLILNEELDIVKQDFNKVYDYMIRNDFMNKKLFKS